MRAVRDLLIDARMRWLCLLLLVGCRTTPLDVGSDADVKSLPDLLPAPCGGFAGVACPTGDFCEMPAGQCFNDSLGTCTPLPTTCGTIFQPVCGCDFVTYPNDCERQFAGVPLYFSGECEGPADLAVVDLTQPPRDLAHPADLGTGFCGTQTCGGNQYCYHGCCGTPGCTPPDPVCVDLPGGCSGCSCLTGAGCTCSDDAAGHISYTCSLCP
jgi:hypothetical protein